MRAGSFGSPAEPLIQLDEEDKEGKARAACQYHREELGMCRLVRKQGLFYPLTTSKKDTTDEQQVNG